MYVDESPKRDERKGKGKKGGLVESKYTSIAIFLLLFTMCAEPLRFMTHCEMTGKLDNNGLVPVKVFVGQMNFMADIDMSQSHYNFFKTDNYIPVVIVLRGRPKVDVWLCGQIINTQDRVLLKGYRVADNMYSYLMEEAK